VALVGSNGLLEVAVRDGDAARALALSRGARVRWVPATRH
jgi:S-adenosylmethionine hydrolase